MAKTTKTGLADDLNAEGSAEDGLIDDLNAGDITQENSHEQNRRCRIADDDDGAEKTEDTESQEYVVLKGNCIRHDGRFTAKICIPVTGKDAERLLAVRRYC
jgi:hypothetical protein